MFDITQKFTDEQWNQLPVQTKEDLLLLTTTPIGVWHRIFSLMGEIKSYEDAEKQIGKIAIAVAAGKRSRKLQELKLWINRL